MTAKRRIEPGLATVTLPEGVMPIVDALNDAVIVADLDGTILFANVATESLLGWTATELVGQPLAGLVPPRLRGAHLDGLARFAGGGAPRLIGQPTRVPALRADGREVAIELLLSTLPTNDGGHYVVGTMRDVRERVDLERDSTLVHHVLDVVSGSSGTPDAIAQLLEVVATTVGWDAAGLWEPDTDAGALRCRQFWTRPELEGEAMETASLAIEFSPGEGLPGRVWTTTAASWIADLVDDDNFPRSASAQRTGLRCGLAFPLVDADEVVAVMELFRTTPSESEPSLMAALEVLGSALGGWLARTRLQEAYEEIAERERTVAEVLRRTLLPPGLPDIAGFDLAAAFQPGADISVGGDFYDACPLPDGSGLSIAVGDVCGSGPEAAAVSGQVRHTLRALTTSTTDSPAGVLTRLDALLTASDNDRRFCTAVFALLRATDDGGISGRLSTAGHPPPLIIRSDGTVETIELRGTLLGILAHGHWGDVDVALDPGDTLVLYTDGVTEARDPQGRQFGEDRLRACCADAAGGGPNHIVRRIHDRAFEHAGRISDDLAVLAISPRPRPTAL